MDNFPDKDYKEVFLKSFFSILTNPNISYISNALIDYTKFLVMDYPSRKQPISISTYEIIIK